MNYILPNSNIGILFPSWLPYNYKKYKLIQEKIDNNIDKCNIKENKTAKIGRKYQLFIQKYLNLNSPYQSILLYHGLGVGKTATSILTYNELYNKSENWIVFIFIKKSLYKGWMNELDKFLEKTNFKKRLDNIYFINYESSNINLQFKEALMNVKSADQNKLFIIDEVHNYIRNVYSNVTSFSSNKMLHTYNYIKDEIANNKLSRLICISGTPVINKPYELALLFNMLRKDTFSQSEDEFNNLFVSNVNQPIINPINLNMFQRRIIGLVSYFENYSKNLYASKEHIDIKIEMTEYQNKIYKYFDEYEKKLEKKSKNIKLFKTYTRQSCNFVFPSISKDIHGINRPRPNEFKALFKNDNQIKKKGKKNKKVKKKDNTSKIIDLYTKKCTEFIKALEIYWDSLAKLDKNFDWSNLINLLKEKYIDDIKGFISFFSQKSQLFKSMNECSGKYTYLCLNLLLNKGNALIYTNYVLMEGIQILKIYFKYFKITKYGEFHGGIKDNVIRENTRAIFNNSNNKNGEKLNVIIISPTTAEGVNLANVRQVHVIEPHWNESRIEQVIGRAVRQCSHADLPMKDRHVKIFKYFMTQSSKILTTDEIIYKLAINKQILIDSFLIAVKQSAVDCELFNDFNLHKNKKYSCFKIPAQDQLNSNLDSIYISNIYKDINKNIGLNQITTIEKDITVIEINAIKKDEKTVNKYLFDNITGYVYDIDVHVLIGQILKDETGVYEMHDEDTFIISRISLIDDYRVPRGEL